MPPDLAPRLAHGAVAPIVGDTVAYRWTVTNTGGTTTAAAATTSLTQSVTTPSARLATLSAAGATCTVSSATCSAPSLAPGASITVTATIDVLRLPAYDVLRGDAGADKLYGGNGNDVIDGGTESDLCRQEAGTGTPTTCEA